MVSNWVVTISISLTVKTFKIIETCIRWAQTCLLYHLVFALMTLGNIYYGMASELGKKDMKADINYIEGHTVKLGSNIITLKENMQRIWNGIQSGVSYGGYKSVSDFIGNGIFEIITWLLNKNMIRYTYEIKRNKRKNRKIRRN